MEGNQMVVKLTLASLTSKSLHIGSMTPFCTRKWSKEKYKKSEGQHSACTMQNYFNTS